MGFKEIVYLGLDLKHHEKKTHFFGADFHSRDHETTEFPKMRRMLERGATTLEGTGIRVFELQPHVRSGMLRSNHLRSRSQTLRKRQVRVSGWPSLATRGKA